MPSPKPIPKQVDDTETQPDDPQVNNEEIFMGYLSDDKSTDDDEDDDEDEGGEGASDE